MCFASSVSSPDSPVQRRTNSKGVARGPLLGASPRLRTHPLCAVAAQLFFAHDGVVAVTVYRLGDVAEQVEDGVGHPDVPVECHADTVRNLLEHGHEHAGEISCDDLAQTPLGLHVGVDAVDHERRGEACDLRRLLHAEVHPAARPQLVATAIVDQLHGGPPLAHRAVRAS